MLEKIQRIHFIGIGGIGMSGLALMMLEQGKEVSGSDLKANETTAKLATLGAKIHIGHHSHNIQNPDLVVYTSAVKADNPELIESKARGCHIMRRAKLLGALTQEKRAIAITGAHGKTTTSAMLVAILDAAHQLAGSKDSPLSPSFVIGGFAQAQQTNARSGQGPYMVIEADESDASFVDLHPHMAVITNIDSEHLDFYTDLSAIQKAMRTFAGMVPTNGAVFCNRDDAHSLQAFMDVSQAPLHFFSLHPASAANPLPPEASLTWAEIQEAGRPSRFSIWHQANSAAVAVKICDINLALGGLHNISNALAAAAVAIQLKLNNDAIAQGLNCYQGVQRRSQLKGEIDHIKIYDDYAHHPTEVTALLRTLKTETTGKLWAVFQPHRYSRFSQHYDEFLKAYSKADAVIVLPVYSAPAYGASLLHDLQDSCASPSRFALLLHDPQQVQTTYATTLEEAVDILQQQLQAGDLVVTTGAGDVYKVGEWLVARLEADQRRLLEASPC